MKNAGQNGLCKINILEIKESAEPVAGRARDAHAVARKMFVLWNYAPGGKKNKTSTFSVAGPRPRACLRKTLFRLSPGYENIDVISSDREWNKWIPLRYGMFSSDDDDDDA